ncbi:MAG: glucosaminidase domain-containing protein [Steroidobacteraceae bacterium]|nr:glucosaminidase domain-containing protein [Steroidobacteraceae bacterium]MDW8258077.1 glucosaminidase domain-containing protein [Gammaproteobacteria bacterium]
MTAPLGGLDLHTAVAVQRAAPPADADTAALREAARQFESLFVRMLLQSMRNASFGDALFDSHEGGLYRDWFDQQVALDMSRAGGLGIAELLVRQLSSARSTRDAGSAGAAQPGPAVAPAPRAPASAAHVDFVRELWPKVQHAAAQLKVDPRHLVAQAALETGWGRDRPGENLFGIKAGSTWQGASVASNTVEYLAGRAERRTEVFRAYPDANASIADYLRMMSGSERYAAVRGTGSDTAAFATALQNGGYATDPQYARKLQATVATVDALLPAVFSSPPQTPIASPSA